MLNHRQRPGQRPLLIFAALLFPAVLAFPPLALASEDILMISREFCPACLAAKKYFDEHGIDYKEYQLHKSERARQAFKRLGGLGTPLLYKDGKTMNGFHPQRFRQFWAETTGKTLPDNPR